MSSVSRGAGDLGGCVEWPPGSNRSEDTGVEEEELWMRDNGALRALREGRHLNGEQQVFKQRKVVLREFAADTALARDCRDVEDRRLRE